MYDLLLKPEETTNITDVRLDKMTESDRKEIEALKERISFDYESISLYGRDVTKKLTDFSSQVLDSVKVKDVPEIEGMLLTLVGDLNRFNTDDLMPKKKKLFGRLFGSDKAESFITKYKSISSVISETKGKLEQAEYQLQKDIKTSEAYLSMNSEYIKALEKYIAAADMRISEERADIEEERKKILPSDTLSAQELAVRESDLKNLEKRAHNLRIQKAIAIQNIPQLMLIKDGDVALVQKIDDGINQAIPLWESQIVIGIQALRQEAGVQLSRGVSDVTNNLLKHNAQALKQSAIGVATENERDLVDVETIKSTNEALIETINGVMQVQKEGEERRKQSIQELAQIQTKLNQALISTGV